MSALGKLAPPLPVNHYITSSPQPSQLCKSLEPKIQAPLFSWLFFPHRGEGCPGHLVSGQGTCGHVGADHPDSGHPAFPTPALATLTFVAFPLELNINKLGAQFIGLLVCNSLLCCQKEPGFLQ